MAKEQRQAFHSIDTSSENIRAGVLVLIKRMGLGHGSVVAKASPQSAYNLYELLDTYMNSTEARLKINAIVDEYQVNQFRDDGRSCVTDS